VNGAPRRRILLIAEAANPEWVSVPLVGWSMAEALRDVADVHIVTQIRNRDAFLRAGLIEGRDFTPIDSERVAAPAYRIAGLLRGGSGKGWTTVTAIQSLVYPHFERLVWRHFGKALRRGDYDIVHRLTPLSPTAYGPLARLCRKAGVPFILGPLNGGLPWPEQFESERRQEKEWLSYIRNLYRLLPNRRATFAAARAIIAGSRHTASEVPPQFAEKVIYMPENGIDPARFGESASPPNDGILRLCFIGRLVPYKGADMAITAALPLLRGGGAHLDILGEGPQRAQLEALVAREGVGAAVTFHGWVDHAHIQNIASRCAVFLFPSVREFGGGAVLEAMALGLAPVVVDHGGPGELVAMGGGIAVPVGDRSSIIDALTQTLRRLASDAEEAAAIGRAAQTWARRKLTWPAKAKAMATIYEWVLGNDTEKPHPY